MFSLLHQQTTVEEQSRIVQLEEELSLRRADIENLQAQLRGADASSQRADGASGPEAQLETLVHFKESSERQDKYEAALAASRQEVDSLKAVVDNKNQEISEMKQKVQQATKENMDMMDTWKVLCFTLWTHVSLLDLLTAFKDG